MTSLAHHIDGKSYYWQGHKTLKVPMELFALNRQRLCERLRANSQTPTNAWVYLEGGKNIPLYNTDIDYNTFRQEPFFMWTFGICLPDLTGLIDVSTDEIYLFVPHFPDEYGVWMGPPPKPDDYRNWFNVKNVFYEEKLKEFLNEKKSTVTFLTLKGVNSDSGLEMLPPKLPQELQLKTNEDLLYNEMCELRVIKTDYEIEVMRYVSEISSEAHKRVMKYIRPGRTEYQCEAVFLRHIYGEGGCRHTSYTCICGTGPNGAILHYGHEGAPNKREITESDMCLFDMGGNYCGYASDITCSYPSTSKFTDRQKLIYNAVLNSNRAVINVLKPGVSWVEMHKLANRVLLEHLVKIGILTGNIEEMQKLQIPAYFQPHGLGHLIGLDVHDVGGYLPGHPERPTERSLKSLRTARVMQQGMCMTVEPGCYFIDMLLDELISTPDTAKFVNVSVLKDFRGMGGVRIEDVVLITNNGCEILSKVPRTVEEIEAFMATKLEE